MRLIKNAILSFIIVFHFLTICTSVYTQEFKNVITGKVVNTETNELIQYATVFLAHTSKGSLTDENGAYLISGISDGNYEIVCAAVGFEKITKQLLVVGKKKIEITFRLNPVPIQVSEVSITASVPEDWEENLIKFTSEFLGESTVARQCIITNPEVIDFEIKEHKLFASSKKPIFVINKALGYKLTVYIKHFEWDVDYDEGRYLYEPFFESLENEDSTNLYRWNENRRIAYYGSFIHFLRSCASSSGFDEGFRIKLGRSREQNIINWQTYDEYIGVLLSFIKNTPDNNFLFETNDQIFVIYKNEKEDPNYKWYTNRVFGTRDTKSYQSSILKFPYGKLTFNKHGNIVESTTFNTSFSGYWAWKRVGDLLPSDYEP